VIASGLTSNPGWSNGFDIHVELFINHFVHKYALVDSFMYTLGSSFFFRGCVPLLLVWYVSFDRERLGQLRKGTDLLFGTMLVSVIAMPAVRIISHILPFRTRPLATPSLHFVAPAADIQQLAQWSSFPSDHAVLFVALATGVFFVSWRAGVLAYVWVAAAICFPRLYLGFHWPTDILAGSALGFGLASIALIPWYRRWVQHAICAQYSRHPSAFYTVLFLYSFQASTMFDDARRILIATLSHSRIY
jgi:membrane-associated phospholipid phosphatase